MSESTSGNVAARMSGRAAKTMSNPPEVDGESARHASFIRRRARLRTTAPPTRRPETKPARTCPSPGRTYSTIRLPGTRRPSRITRRTSAPRRSLASEPGTRGPVAVIRRFGFPPPEGGYAETRSRPLARRRARIRRPPRVLIRRRNPWVFLRLRLFGWYVRFTWSSDRLGRLAPYRNARRVYRPMGPIIPGNQGRPREARGRRPAIDCGKRSSIPPVRLAPFGRPGAIIPRASHRGSSVPFPPPGRPVKFPQLWKVIVDKCRFPCQSVLPVRGRP